MIVKCVCPQYTATNMVTSNFMTEDQLQLVKNIGLIKPEQVAEAIVQLATDQSTAGAVMTVTLSRGIDYFHLPGDPDFRSKNSKL